MAEDLFERGLCLPSGTEMTDEDIGRVVSVIISCREKIINPQITQIFADYKNGRSRDGILFLILRNLWINNLAPLLEIRKLIF